jgi:hypothetical protein
MEEIEKQIRYTNTKTHIVLRYVLAFFMILLYPTLHIVMASLENFKLSDDFMGKLSVGAGVGVFLFFEPQIQRMVLLYLKYRYEKDEKYRKQIIAEYLQQQQQKDNDEGAMNSH